MAFLFAFAAAEYLFSRPIKYLGQWLNVLHAYTGAPFPLKISILKIATFNINNINKRLDNLLAWLAKAQPEVVCLQELKAEQRAFPETALRSLGYHAVWHGERSWNGVAILARGQD